MKAGIVYAQGDIRYGEWERPKPGPEDVLVRVRVCGICGSDVPRVWGTAAHTYPVILGHEFAGEIVAVGERVAGRSVGDRVSCAPLVPCMDCDACHRGDYALCPRYSFIGSRAPGAFAEYVACPARNTIKLPENVDYRTGSFFEPTTVALHGLWRNGYQSGEPVLILGAGTIGMLTALCARALGSKSVTLCDIDPRRLEIARSLGFSAAYNTGESGFLGAAMEASPGRQGYACVLETAGAPAAMQLTFQLAAPHARVCFIGTSTKGILFDHRVFELLNRKEFTLTGSWMSYSAPFPGREWVQVAQMFHTGRLRIEPEMIHAIYPLAQIGDAFALYQTPGQVTGKVLIEV